jgi:hypothetical protein
MILQNSMSIDWTLHHSGVYFKIDNRSLKNENQIEILNFKLESQLNSCKILKQKGRLTFDTK